MLSGSRASRARTIASFRWLQLPRPVDKSTVLVIMILASYSADVCMAIAAAGLENAIANESRSIAIVRMRTHARPKWLRPHAVAHVHVHTFHASTIGRQQLVLPCN